MESRVRPLLRPYLSLLIIVPTKDQNDAEYFLEMVKDINANEVASEDVLSDSVYLFSREGEELELIISSK